MRFLRAKFQGQSDFLESYQKDSPSGELFVATTEPFEPDASVIVELICDGLPNKVLIRGSVKSWRPALPRLRVRAGALVTFNPDEETKREFVLKTLAGELTPPRRRHVRIPVQLAARYRFAGSTETKDAEILEISVGGALLGGVDASLGSEMVVDLVPPGGAAPIEITGRVSYHTPQGCGLRFMYRDGGGSRRLRELIRRICAS